MDWSPIIYVWQLKIGRDVSPAEVTRRSGPSPTSGLQAQGFSAEKKSSYYSWLTKSIKIVAK